MKRKLAFIGDFERGEEIIDILKMLGGRNKDNFYTGRQIDCLYFINHFGDIDIDGPIDSVESLYDIYKLEDFLECYPYMVSDIVCLDDGREVEIANMEYDGVDIIYNYIEEGKVMKLCPSLIMCKVTKPKPTDLTLKGVDNINQKIEINLNEYEYKVEDNKLIIQKKNIYPNSYEECEFIATQSNGFEVVVHSPAYMEEMQTLIKLLICRDAYWKLANCWKPNWEDKDQLKYMITCFNNGIEFFASTHSYVVERRNHLLAFPTIEMRDAFYKNFKEDIVKCKYFL